MDKNNNKERLHVGENRGFWGLWGLLRVAALFVSLATLHYTLFFLYPVLVEFKGMLYSWK